MAGTSAVPLVGMLADMKVGNLVEPKVVYLDDYLVVSMASRKAVQLGKKPVCYWVGTWVDELVVKTAVQMAANLVDH